MDRDFPERLALGDMTAINLELAYRMLSDIEMTPAVPSSVKAVIGRFLADRYYFRGDNATRDTDNI